MSSNWGTGETQYFYTLDYDQVLVAAEQIGYQPTGRILTMGSMENRVYEVELHDCNIILKFYRPGRWSFDQIQEEHDFLLELQEFEIPVIAPLVRNQKSLHIAECGLYFAAFPKQGGRAAEEWTAPLVEQMGRLLARIHRIGKTKKAYHRNRLDIETFGRKNLDFLATSPYLDPQYKNSYMQMAELALKYMEPIFKNLEFQRVHGDCHHGNILLGSSGPYLIDFDDMVVAPCVQDIWMAIPGRDEESLELRQALINSYETMNEFNRKEIYAIEALRTLRIINFAAWIAHRYEDQAFRRAFEIFGTPVYWEREIQSLREQVSLIQMDVDKLTYL